MADTDTKSAIDRLTRRSEEARPSAQGSAAAAPSLEEALGLMFRRGDRVIDTLTGERATIHSGRRSSTTGRGVYVVNLRSGVMTHRDERELERDAPAAPAPATR